MSWLFDWAVAGFSYLEKGCGMAEANKRVVEVVRSDYQPSKAELDSSMYTALEADMRVDATFEGAVAALCQSVEIRQVTRPR